MLIIFLVIVLDLVGFGIMVPILAYYVVQLGGGPELATLCMSLYSLGMLVATPVMGRLSDIHGRKPVLVLSMVGAIIGYLMLGFAESIWVIALSRLLAGSMAGNISAAQAYIADITSPADRAKGMGMIGAAFGIGFILGPALGSWLAGDDFATANLVTPALLSAALATLALLTVIFRLPESLHPTHRAAAREAPRVGRIRALGMLWSRNLVPQFLIGVLFYNLGAGLVEAIYPLWVRDTGIAAGPRDLTPLLLAGGLVMAVVQGGLIGPLARRFGERCLFQWGALLFTLAMLATIAAGTKSNYYAAMAAIALQSIASALVLTSMQSLVSQLAEPQERGMLLGVYASAGTLGRAAGTLLTGLLFAQLGIHSPYWIAAGVMLLLLVIARDVASRSRAV
ncbi:MFS transporter [Haliea sp. E17]|uniref:MFS transporter n=1 Tax=Haliea sp. E17 TaxID=3401576 RepID=UPI003AAD38F3